MSDRLVDAIIGHGDPAASAAKVREHLAAGADHVTLLPPVGTDFAVGVDQLERLAGVLTALVGVHDDPGYRSAAHGDGHLQCRRRQCTVV